MTPYRVFSVYPVPIDGVDISVDHSPRVRNAESPHPSTNVSDVHLMLLTPQSDACSQPSTPIHHENTEVSFLFNTAMRGCAAWCGRLDLLSGLSIAPSLSLLDLYSIALFHRSCNDGLCFHSSHWSVSPKLEVDSSLFFFCLFADPYYIGLHLSSFGMKLVEDQRHTDATVTARNRNSSLRGLSFDRDPSELERVLSSLRLSEHAPSNTNKGLDQNGYISGRLSLCQTPSDGHKPAD